MNTILLFLALLCLQFHDVHCTSSSRITINKINFSGVASPKSESNQYASGVTREPERLSGYFTLNRTYDAHMFFFYFEAREDPQNAPIVLWMTGGPGCSSELAIFYENGPWNIRSDLTLEETEYGWDRGASMIFVDQPINTGFSYSEDDRDRCYDETCVSNDMLDFLEAFFEAKPALKGRPFYVTGESYAGHYVPAVASRVFKANREGKANINLQGFAIGNGLTKPATQYGAYAPFALQHDLIDKDLHDNIMSMYPACKFGLQVCDGLDWSVECALAVEFCQATMFAPIMVENPTMNVYDYRKECKGDLCYDFTLMEEYLNLPEVRKALGVGDRKWESCNMQVHEDMMADWAHSFDGVIPEMLSAGVRAMIYAGDKDFICNVLGNRRWIDELEWDRSDEWKKAKESSWEVDGEEAGSVVEVDGLSFVTVFKAGHMVPMDQAKNAYDMIYKFTRGESLVSGGGGGGSVLDGIFKGVEDVVLKMGRKERMGRWW